MAYNPQQPLAPTATGYNPSYHTYGDGTSQQQQQQQHQHPHEPASYRTHVVPYALWRDTDHIKLNDSSHHAPRNPLMNEYVLQVLLYVCLILTCILTLRNSDWLNDTYTRDWDRAVWVFFCISHWGIWPFFCLINVGLALSTGITFFNSCARRSPHRAYSRDVTITPQQAYQRVRLHQIAMCFNVFLALLYFGLSFELTATAYGSAHVWSAMTWHAQEVAIADITLLLHVLIYVVLVAVQYNLCWWAKRRFEFAQKCDQAMLCAAQQQEEKPESAQQPQQQYQYQPAQTNSLLISNPYSEKYNNNNNNNSTNSNRETFINQQPTSATAAGPTYSTPTATFDSTTVASPDYEDYKPRNFFFNLPLLQVLTYAGLIALTPLVLQGWQVIDHGHNSNVGVFFIVWNWSIAPLLLLTTLPSLFLAWTTTGAYSTPYIRDPTKTVLEARALFLWGVVKAFVCFGVAVWSFICAMLMLSVVFRNKSWAWEYEGYYDAMAGITCMYTTIGFTIATACEYYAMCAAYRRQQFVVKASRVQNVASRNFNNNNSMF